MSVWEKKRRNQMNCPYARAHGYFCLLNSFIFFLQFSLHFREKFFWWAQGENTQISLFIFLPPHPPNTLKKKNFFPFFLQSFSSTLFHLQTNTPSRSVWLGRWKSKRIEKWKDEFFFFFLVVEKSRRIENVVYINLLLCLYGKKKETNDLGKSGLDFD